MVLDRSDLELILLVIGRDRLTPREITHRAALRLRITDHLDRPLPDARGSAPSVGVPKE